MVKTSGGTSRVRAKAPALSPADVAILQALSRLHILSAQQVCRLLYSDTSLTYVQTKLKTLTDRELCQRLYLPRTTRFGSAPSLYTLARKGLNFLKAVGFDLPDRFRPGEQQQSYLHMSHTVAANDFLIAIELLCRRVRGLELHEVLHERVLKREPVYVQTEGGKLAVIPDGWIDVRVGRREQICLALECDRGSEEEKKWRRKVRGLVAWAKGPYQERFKTTSLTVAVVATPGEKRVVDLLRWTEMELRALGQERHGDLFRFTGLSPVELTPEEFFLSRHWRRPFAVDRVALIDRVS